MTSKPSPLFDRAAMAERVRQREKELRIRIAAEIEAKWGESGSQGSLAMFTADVAAFVRKDLG